MKIEMTGTRRALKLTAETQDEMDLLEKWPGGKALERIDSPSVLYLIPKGVWNPVARLTNRINQK